MRSGFPVVNFDGSSKRLNVAITSSAVNGEPSWNLTPLRSLTVYFVGLIAFADSARPFAVTGWNFSLKVSNVSNVDMSRAWSAFATM